MLWTGHFKLKQILSYLQPQLSISPALLLLATAPFHLSSIATKEYCALKYFLKTHWYHERFWSASTASCLYDNFPKILDITGSILIRFHVLKRMEICNNLKIHEKIHKYSLQIYQHYLLNFLQEYRCSLQLCED